MPLFAPIAASVELLSQTLPAGPQAGQQDPERAVGGSQPWTRHGALEDDQLVPQRQVLEHERALSPDTRRRPMRISVIMRPSSIRPADRSMLTRQTE
jgi:hypothetical protein